MRHRRAPMHGVDAMQIMRAANIVYVPYDPVVSHVKQLM